VDTEYHRTALSANPLSPEIPPEPPPLPIALQMRLLGFLGTIHRERHGNEVPKLQGRRIAA
jgi:hypothetical protein